MSELDCEEARLRLLDDARGGASAESARALQGHLADCPACARAAAEERVVSELLRTRLSRRTAPAALREKLAAQVALALEASPPAAAGVTPAPRQVQVWSRRLPASLAAAALALVLGLSWFGLRRDGEDPILREALNDHLRVLYAARPIEIENGGIHQVKPWFSGRIDFAPDVSFSGDDEFPMLGGAVGYFLDRKAANFVFKRRLHTISLFVFRERGLNWPDGETRAIGSLAAHVGTLDGFNLVLWREHGLGHALVSDVSADELIKLGSKLTE